ncbi:phosphotransferase [Marinomonas sp. 2405UD68-3]|uniref:phosphotransferase n=1 Tax=Marinomonas sp. 2405UD68-3 TaxID=3391835 RepID=UPI0039C95259
MVKLGKMIGSGHWANVYEYNNDHVIKLFHKHVDQSIAQYEFEVSNKIYKLGISTPAAYDLVQLDIQKGIVFQKVNGSTLVEEVAHSPFKLMLYVKQSAQLFAHVHKLKATGLMSFKFQLSERISLANQLDQIEQDSIKYYLSTLEDDCDLCHGDFHFGNIMIEDDSLKIIDWGGVSCGPKIADLTLAIIQFQVASMTNKIPTYLKIIISMFRPFIIHKFIDAYCQSNPNLNIDEVKESIQRWRLPIAAARLISCNAEESKTLLNIIRKEMQRHQLF